MNTEPGPVTPEPPIIVVTDPDIWLSPSVEQAAGDMEAIDVINGEYMAVFDRRGLILVPRPQPDGYRVRIEVATPARYEPTHSTRRCGAAARVHRWLPAGSLSDESTTDDLIEMLRSADQQWVQRDRPWTMVTRRARRAIRRSGASRHWVMAQARPML